MKLCRFNSQRLGCVENNEVIDVTKALGVLPALSWPLAHGDVLIANLGEIVKEVQRIKAAAPRLRLEDVSLLSPIANPGKIMAAPGNYRAHVEMDTKDPEIDAGVHRESMLAMEAPTEKLGIFLKANSSLVGASEGVELLTSGRRIDHEVELTLVIGRQGKNIKAADALSYVAGYMIGLDMTVRGAEDRSFRKSADSFSVMGPYFVTADEIPDPGNLELRLDINGATRQQTNTKLLTVGIHRMIEIASANYTLYPGDILMTGTPEGVGPVQAGDVLLASCSSIGEMIVKIRAGTT